MNLVPSGYNDIVLLLKEKIRNARLKAVLTANAQLLEIYWEIGKVITEQEESEGWGTKTIDRLSVDLRTEFEDMKGFSIRNLRYMRDFYKAYPLPQIWQHAVAKTGTTDIQPAVIWQQAVAKLPWGHHTVILLKAKTVEERIFYIQKCVENNWSRSVLSLQIESNLFQRSGNAITNFSHMLPPLQADLAVATFKNPYLFDFMAMGEKMQERELEKGLIEHLKKFMRELGKGFAYVGNQYNLKVEGDDYFLDLLFYSIPMKCYVIFELKIGEFKPEYAGKLNFYINTVDAQIKMADDNRTIGVLLCKTPNDTVVKFALQGIQSPMGVSEFQLADALPKQLKAEMPTIEELEKEIEQGYEELKNPLDKKLDRLKEMLKDLKHPEVKEKKEPENIKLIFERLIPGLQKKILSKATEIKEMFQEIRMGFVVENMGFATYENAEAHLRDKNKYYCNLLRIEITCGGFRQAGTKAFNSWTGIQVDFHEYKYQLTLLRMPEDIIVEKLYHELPIEDEQNLVVDKWFEYLLDDITQQIERIKK